MQLCCQNNYVVVSKCYVTVGTYVVCLSSGSVSFEIW